MPPKNIKSNFFEARLWWCVAFFSPPLPPEAVLWFPLNFFGRRITQKGAPEINQESLSKTSAAYLR